MAVRVGDDKPFVCPVIGCRQGFTTEDRLAVHRSKHDNVFPFPISLDQTPTPSQFLRDCESLYLANPFEESFKRVNSCELQPPLLVPGPADTVSTPSIAITEDDIAAAAMAVELMPAGLRPLLPDDDVSPDDGAMASVSESASSSVVEASRLPCPAEGYTAAGAVATGDLFKEVHPDDDCCHLDDAGALCCSEASDVDAVSVVDESSAPAARKPALPAAPTGVAAGMGGKQQRIGSRGGIVRPAHHVSRSCSSTPAGSPAGGRLADVSSSGCDAAPAAATSLSVHAGSAVSAGQLPAATAPGLSVSGGAAAAATSCTMQLLLHMPNGQTITLPAAILPSQVVFDLGSGTSAEACPLPSAVDKLASQAAAATPSAALTSPVAGLPALMSSCEAMAAAGGSGGNGKRETSSGGGNVGMSLAKQKLKEALQRDTAAVSGLFSSGGVQIQSAFGSSPQLQLLQYSEHCVGSTTGGKLRRPRQSSSEDDPEDKRGKFLERNREAARRCRSKKKEWITSLEQRNEDLQGSQLRLQAEIASLRAEVADLKSVLLEHQDCPVTQLQKQSGRLAFSRSGSAAPHQDSA